VGTPIRPDVPLSPAEQLRRAQEPKEQGIAPAERLREARDLTRDAEPTRAARVLRVQGQSAFPTDFVERNLDVLEKEVNQPTFDADRFWKESPAVAQWLSSDPTRVAATGRDIQRMGSVERYLRAIGTEVERNKITTDLAQLAPFAMFGNATPEQEQAIQTLQRRQAGLPDVLGERGFVAGIPIATIGQLPITLSLYKGAATGLGVGAAVGGAVGAARGAPAGPAGIASGAVTGAARGAFLGSRVGVATEGMKLEAALAFLEYRELPNVDRETAAVGALVAGVVAGALELVPFEAASKTIPGLRRLGKEGVREMLMAPTTRGLLQKYAGHILANMGAEGLTEGAQAMVQHVGKVLTQRIGDGTLSQLSPATLLRELFGDAEAWSGILAEARAGAQAGAGFATTTQGVSTAVDFRAVRRAEQNAQRMQAAAEAIHGNDRETAMTIAKDAPQAMQDAVASVGSDGAYFDINAFTSYWQSQTTPDGEAANPRDVALALGVTAPEYDAALETQGTIHVLAERLLVDGMGSATHRQWFVDHLRSTPNELSRIEAQERLAQMDQEAEQAPEVPSRVMEADAAVETLREKLTTELRGARVQAQELEAGVALWTENLRTTIERNPDIPVADIVKRFERVQVVARPVAALPDGKAVSAFEVTNETMDRGDGVQVPVLRSTRSARAQAARMQERLASKYNGDVMQMPEKERAQYEAVTQAAVDAETLNKSLTPVDYAALRGPVVMGSPEQQAIVNVEANADVLEQAAFHGTPTSGITQFDRLAPRGLSSKPNRMDSVGSWFSLNAEDTKPFLAGWDWTRNQMVPASEGTLYQVDLDYSNPKTYPTFQALMDDFNVAVGRDWKSMDRDTRGAEGIFPDGGNIFNAYLKAQGYDAIVVEQQGGIDQAVESQSYIAVLSPETQVTITHRNGEPVTAQERTDFLAQEGGASPSLPETLDIDGVARPTRNSTGQPIHPTEEGVRNFWLWFGDSKVVDAEGRPLVVYHGTDAADFGEFSGPTYWSTSASESSAYANANQLAQRERLRNKWAPVQANGSLDGVKVQYAGIISDAREKGSVGDVWATDNGVVRIGNGGKIEVFTDVIIDPNASFDVEAYYADEPSQTLTSGKSDAYDIIAADNEEFIARNMSRGEGGRVYAAYLKIENPMVLGAFGSDRSGNAFSSRLFSPEIVERNVAEVREQGYDGVQTESDEAALFPEVQEGLGGIPAQYVTFDGSQVKSALGNSGEFGPTANILRQGGQEPRGAFIAPAGRIDGPRLIALFKEKNQTTFLHESSHAFLDLWTDLANDPAASPQFRELVAGLRTELGATGNERLSVAQEEAFAGMFLDYAKSGKAPSLTLRQAFASFAAFLSKLWSFVEGEIVPANANVTDLLSRLLATDEAIEAARGEFMAPLFPEDAVINEAFVKARTFAEEQTRTEAMRTIVRAEQEWWKKESKRVEEEVRERVAQDPAYIARQAFTALQNPDGTPLPADSPFRAKLNKAQIVGILGDEATKALPRGKAGAVYATASEGMDVGTAATVLGYESASALLEAIRTTQPIEDHITQVTDATMKERYGDPMTDGTIPEVAIEAVHNDALDQMRRLEIETIIRENPTQFRDAAVRAASRPLNLRELKAWAESHIAQIPLKALRPQQYESAERKATKDAVRAVAEGKWAEAVQAKARQRMSAALYAEALAARDRMAKAQKLFGKVLGNDEKIAARRNFDIVQAARQILANVGVGRKADDTAFYLQQLAEYDPATAQTLEGVVTELNKNVPPRDHLRDLSVEEFDAVAEAVEFMWQMSSDVNMLTIAGERVSKEEVLAPMMDRLREMKDSAVEGAGRDRLATWTDKANKKLLTVKAAGRRVESWADFMDGGDIAGPFRGGLFQEVRDQTANKAKAQAADLERYETLLKGVRPHLAFSEIAAPELGRGKWVFKDTAHLLGALLHTGNPSNFQMFLDGRGWTKDQWFAFRDRMVAEGKLVPEHFDFVQGVWNLFEDKKPEAQKVYRRMFGKYFAEITREGFAVTFPDGTTRTYAGGYTPASKDPDASTAAAKRSADALLEEAYGMRFPTVQKGFTISRVQNAEPLLLSLDIVKKHLDATNKFIYLAEPVRQVGRLLRDREFRAEMDRVNPSIVNELLMPWLERSATQVVERPSGSSPLARMGDGVAKYLRTTAGASFMFLNVANTLEQATGLSVAAVRVDPKYMSLAEVNYLRDADGVREMINTASPFMDTRNTTQVGPVMQRIETLSTNPNVFQQAQSFALEHAYILQSLAQNHVDTIVWYGSYLESLDKGMRESDAVKKADADVRLTQGSFDAVDVSALESGTPWFRLVAMFAGYFNMLANLNATEMAKAVEQMGVKRSIPRLFTVYGLGFAVPMLASNLIRRGMMGRAAFGDFDGEDEWGYLDDWFAWFFGEQARGLTAMAPPAGSAVNFLIAQFDDKPFNDQLSISPALSFVESAGRGVKANYDLFTGEPFQRRDVRDMLALFSLMTRVPATGFARPLTYLYDVQTGRAEPSGPIDFTRGVLSGQPGTIR
jgi:hypothetical protein